MAKIHAKMSAKAKKRRKRRCNRQKRLKPTRLSYVHSCASRRAQTFCKWLIFEISAPLSGGKQLRRITDYPKYRS